MNHTCSSEATNVTSSAAAAIASEADDAPRLLLLGGHLLWEVALIVLVSVPLTLVTILGNLLVLVSFRVNAALRTTSNYYLLSLAVADLILGTVSMNLYTAYILLGRWALGPVACDLWLAVDYVASNASIMNLLAISFDRYFSVTRPLTYRAKRTPKRAVVMIGLAWSVSFLLWGPAILFWPYMVGRPPAPSSSSDGVEEVECSLPFFKVPLLMFGTAIAAFYLPVCIMVILYWRIYWEIQNRAKGLALLLGQNAGAGTGAFTPNSLRKQSMTMTYPGTGSQDNSLRDPEEEVPIVTNKTQRWPKTCCLSKDVGLQQLHKGKSGVAVILETASSKKREGGFLEEFDSWRRNTNKAEEEEEEEECVVTIPSGEEQDIQDIQGSNTTIKLKLLHKPSDGSLDIKMSPRASITTAGQTSKRSSLNAGPVNKNKPTMGSLRPQKGKRRRNMIIREKKAARTLSAILLAFILTWTPYNVMVLASMSYCVPEKLWHLGYWLCYVNSTVNPMCYALCNKSFRSTFKMLLLCRQSGHKSWGISSRSKSWGVSSRSHHHTSTRTQQTCSTV
ncbi:muscarinic acetylcholine receptor M1 [Engraulis encrasicolus]|uniref:muscarinic acetylcholine receptor M1 n=1 Tax=Engraulis encrasicolus TaxID=184585 RepID=UPI002FCE7BC9